LACCRQPLGLEAAHLAAGRGEALEPLPADDRPHGWIAGEPLGIVDILVAGQASEYRLPQQPGQPMLGVLASATIRQCRRCHVQQAHRMIQLAVSEQAAVGSDPGTVEFQLDPTVEIDPERLRFRFTHRVRHDRPTPLTLTS